MCIRDSLFPDMPSNRYAEVAPRVRALCQKYGLPYVSGPMLRQVGQTWRSIGRLSLPDSLRARLSRRGSVRARPIIVS